MHNTKTKNKLNKHTTKALLDVSQSGEMEKVKQKRKK